MDGWMDICLMKESECGAISMRRKTLDKGFSQTLFFQEQTLDTPTLQKDIFGRQPEPADVWARFKRLDW
jgi:hypothetical protein